MKSSTVFGAVAPGEGAVIAGLVSGNIASVSAVPMNRDGRDEPGHHGVKFACLNLHRPHFDHVGHEVA